MSGCCSGWGAQCPLWGPGPDPRLLHPTLMLARPVCSVAWEPLLASDEESTPPSVLEREPGGHLDLGEGGRTDRRLTQSRGPSWRRWCRANRSKSNQTVTTVTASGPPTADGPGQEHGAWHPAVRRHPCRGASLARLAHVQHTSRTCLGWALGTEPLLPRDNTHCPGPRDCCGYYGQPCPGRWLRSPPAETCHPGPPHPRQGTPKYPGQFSLKFCNISRKQTFTLKSQSRCPL